jgi:pimeloyl-ACP methyl ester carboxylesterase
MGNNLRYSFDLLSANTKKLLDTLGIQRAAIVGHSFGGMLAIYFARTYPDITSALVLENPIGLEDYRSAIPPQTLATLIATEMAQRPDSYRTLHTNPVIGQREDRPGGAITPWT